ncbi:hypothetical protein P22_0243 [Propionispora sp. 2/2-37]|uniref:nitroreductase family protein n=1 Tax=Propionispora sp. 2/2-37 TaxID=1677858 RepID=UPI0006BB6F9C|nr:nitroreductase [Propionispora sp. 2/2-37]CUH94177.1 hypothetical protein P22_0243 [Propionispora sp. 2/2-37]
MEFKNTLYTRRSVRKYTEQQPDKSTILTLLDAATQAPSATNSQPWCFAVIQDRVLLKNYSDRIKTYLLSILDTHPSLLKYKPLLEKDNYDVFHNAGTLLIIYAKPKGPFACGDCCLAAQNIMLTAHDSGLGTCWIGFAQDFLQKPDIKQELNIPAEYTMVAPLILGYPATQAKPLIKKKPEILYWKK